MERVFFLMVLAGVWSGTEHDLVYVVQSACLAHDIGNPPFGHAGEYAIREWIKAHQREVFGDQIKKQSVKDDLITFDGNAQGYRVAARADNPKGGYLSLTYATLGAMVKYPWDSDDARAKKKGKFGVLHPERELFHQMVESLGMRRPDGLICRHPLSFLSEAADDICYRILDIEDAAEMGILDEKRVREVCQSLAEGASGTSDSLPIEVLRGRAIRALIGGAWGVFERDYDSIMRGTRSDDLKTDLEPKLGNVIRDIGALYDEIFANRDKVAIELGAYNSLGRIIRALCCATQELARVKSFEQCSFNSQRCLELAWGKVYAEEYSKQRYSWWIYQVMDYVAGLTDNYAQQVSREIEGL